MFYLGSVFFNDLFNQFLSIDSILLTLLMTEKLMNVKDVLMSMHIHYTALILRIPYEPKSYCIAFNPLPDSSLCKS